MRDCIYLGKITIFFILAKVVRTVKLIDFLFVEKHRLPLLLKKVTRTDGRTDRQTEERID